MWFMLDRDSHIAYAWVINENTCSDHWYFLNPQPLFFTHPKSSFVSENRSGVFRSEGI